MASPLQQANATTASGDVNTQLVAGLLDRVNATSAEAPDQQQAYEDAKQKVQAAYAQRSVEGEDAAQWAALAKGFAAPAENFWASLGNAGAGKGQAVANIEADRLKQSREAAKLEYDHQTKLLQDQDTMNRLLGVATLKGQAATAAKLGAVRPVKMADGSWGTWNPATQTIDPIDATQQAALGKEEQDLFKLFSKSLDTTNPADVEKAVKAEMARRHAPQATPQPQQGGMQPVSTKPLLTTSAPAPLDDSGQTVETQPQYIAELGQMLQARNATNDPSERARISSAISEAMTNLKAQGVNLKDAVARAAAVPDVGSRTLPTDQPSGLKLKSAEVEAEKAARGKERGTEMEKSFHQLQAAGLASQDLNAQLELMKGLFLKHGDDIPSGEMAPLIARVKSGLDTFGIKFEGTGATDVINGIGTMGALKSRTADGQNLLPGAMSNYEDQLLQKVFPGLGKTREGRMMQINMLQSQLKMKAELAAKAREHYNLNGKLDNKWYDTASTVAAKNPYFDPKRVAAMELLAKRQAGSQ